MLATVVFFFIIALLGGASSTQPKIFPKFSDQVFLALGNGKSQSNGWEAPFDRIELFMEENPDPKGTLHIMLRYADQTENIFSKVTVKGAAAAKGNKLIIKQTQSGSTITLRSRDLADLVSYHGRLDIPKSTKPGRKSDTHYFVQVEEKRAGEKASAMVGGRLKAIKKEIGRPQLDTKIQKKTLKASTSSLVKKEKSKNPISSQEDSEEEEEGSEEEEEEGSEEEEEGSEEEEEEGSEEEEEGSEEEEEGSEEEEEDSEGEEDSGEKDPLLLETDIEEEKLKSPISPQEESEEKEKDSEEKEEDSEEREDFEEKDLLFLETNIKEEKLENPTSSQEESEEEEDSEEEGDSEEKEDSEEEGDSEEKDPSLPEMDIKKEKYENLTSSQEDSEEENSLPLGTEIKKEKFENLTFSQESHWEGNPLFLKVAIKEEVVSDPEEPVVADYYQVLGLERHAKMEDIEKAILEKIAQTLLLPISRNAYDNQLPYDPIFSREATHEQIQSVESFLSRKFDNDFARLGLSIFATELDIKLALEFHPMLNPAPKAYLVSRILANAANALLNTHNRDRLFSKLFDNLEQVRQPWTPTGYTVEGVTAVTNFLLKDPHNRYALFQGRNRLAPVDLQKEYSKMAREFHPRNSKAPGALRISVLLWEAYEVLTARRKESDSLAKRS